MPVLKLLRRGHEGREQNRPGRDDDHEATRRMIRSLGRVDPRERTELAVHADKCGPRFELTAGMCLDNSRQIREVSGTVQRMHRNVMLCLIASTFTLGIVELFGKEKGAQIVMALIEHIL